MNEPVDMSRVPAGTAMSPNAGPLLVAGAASLGAGAIHAAAIGVHGEHTPAVVAFTLVAVFQLGWGALALTRFSRPLALAGAAGNALLIGGWLLAKTRGLPLVDGLDRAEDVQLADGLAAGLATVAVVGALAHGIGAGRRHRRSGSAPAIASGAAVLVAAVALPGMLAAGNHAHGGAHGDRAHGADGHGDAHDDAAAAPGHDGATVPAVVPPKPYDPTKPLDLSGVAGVTPEQQARAENLIAVTLVRLPRYADPATAEADGFRSVGDGVTGEEHYVNWSYVNDDKILDPDYPESLVYRLEAGGRKALVAAMFMLPEGSTLDAVPDVGGKLTQWHVHNDLCFTPDPEAPRLAGFVGVDQPCGAPLVKRGALPMIHVWIVPHRCGPFAAQEGIAGGQVKPGEERLCDHAHGVS